MTDPPDLWAETYGRETAAELRAAWAERNGPAPAHTTEPTDSVDAPDPACRGDGECLACGHVQVDPFTEPDGPCEVCGLDPEEACADCLACDLDELARPDAKPRRLTRQEREWQEAMERTRGWTDEDWSNLWRERYDPTAAFINSHASCVRCGRQDAGFGINDHHYCGPPYFRPRGLLHPSGPTRAQQHDHANPTLF